MSRRILPLLISFAVACHVWPGPAWMMQAAAESGLQTLVAEGERLWRHSRSEERRVGKECRL